MLFDPNSTQERAKAEYDRARRNAFFNRVRSFFTRRNNLLLPFERLRARLCLTNQHDNGIQVVPLVKIVGTLGRPEDFDRHFMPVREVTSQRWLKIARAVERGESLPPVDLIKVGERYFVVDGNHRVSVSKTRGQDFIEAHVIEVETPFEFRTTMEMRALLVDEDNNG